MRSRAGKVSVLGKTNRLVVFVCSFVSVRSAKEGLVAGVKEFAVETGNTCLPVSLCLAGIVLLSVLSLDA